MRVYLDASVVLEHVLLQGGRRPGWRQWSGACASALTWVEGRRTIDRRRLAHRWTDEEVAGSLAWLQDSLDGVEKIPLSDYVLDRAGQSFPLALGTLDAIHLASALLWAERRGESIHFLTHDRRLGLAARAVGLPASGFAGS